MDGDETQNYVAHTQGRRAAFLYTELNEPSMVAKERREWDASARQQQEEMLACELCGLVQRAEPGTLVRCVRCNSIVHRRKPNTIGRTAAFCFAALILYIPANIYPMVHVEYLGRERNMTIFDGVVTLYETGAWFVGTLVFATSILTPGLKVAGLLFLVLTISSNRWRKTRTRIHRFINIINPWNMFEVYLVSLVVGIAKFGEIANVAPGPGALAFALVVALTTAGSATFDARTIWDPQQRRSDERDESAAE